MHQSLQVATFHIEHILPESEGGGSTLDNLALAYPSCNLHKSDRTEACDPATGALAALFHPRRDVWSLHFAWAEYEVVGLSSVGRATVEALHLNSPRRLKVRRAEQGFGLFPPIVG
jgi:hypothetical protein